MYEELTPELSRRIIELFRKNMAKLQSQELETKIRRGLATQADISAYADKVGRAGSAAMKQVLRLEELPDATMYREIADQTITPVMEEMWGDVNNKAALQLRQMDRKNGMNVGIKTGFKPERRIKDVVSMVAGQTTQEAVDNALTDPVIATARKYYDDFMRENADLRNDLGFTQIVIRKYDDRGLHNGKDPCQWCLAREGTWSLYDAHMNGVFERHPGCNCMIEVISSAKTQVQTDWSTNTWSDL